MTQVHRITKTDELEPLLGHLVDEHKRPINISGDTIGIRMVDANDKDTVVLNDVTANVTNGQAGDGITAITAVTTADPVQVTSTSHGLSTGDRVYIAGDNSGPVNIPGNMVGMEEISNRYFIVTSVDANNVTLDNEAGDFHHAWVSGGYVVSRGIVKYDWQTADVANAGLYVVQWIRTNTTNERIPIAGEFLVEIVEVP